MPGWKFRTDEIVRQTEPTFGTYPYFWDMCFLLFWDTTPIKNCRQPFAPENWGRNILNWNLPSRFASLSHACAGATPLQRPWQQWINCRHLSLVLIPLDNFMHLTSAEIRRPPTGVGGQPYAASCSSNDRPAFALHCPAMNSTNLLQGIQNTAGKYRSHDVFYPTSKGDADETLFPRWCSYRISKVNLLLACSYNILQLYTVWKRIWPGYFGYSIQKIKTK